MPLAYLKNGATLALASDKCNGCGRCYDVCPHNVLQIQERKAQIVHKELCMECGACQKNCSVAAITVNAGVGCANAILRGYFRRTAPTCGPSCGC